jgi:plasmid stabilization system protein ParE
MTVVHGRSATGPRGFLLRGGAAARERVRRELGSEAGLIAQGPRSGEQPQRQPDERRWLRGGR